MVFSIAFLAASTACGVLAGYIISLNPKGTMNRLFFMVCVLISTWSLGFGLSASAADMQTSLLWQRVAAVGWCSFYSIFLHFVLVLTGHESGLKKRWKLLALYAPTILNLYLFVVPNPINPEQFQVVHTVFGWVNIFSNWWMTYFNIYYLSVMASVLFLVWFWGKGSPQAKKQAKMFFVSWLFASACATVTDTVLSKYTNILFPQMAPIIMIVPLAVIYYAIRQYGFLKPKIRPDEQILDRLARKRVYGYLSAAYVIGAVLFALAGSLSYLDWDPGYMVFFSILLVSFAAAIQVVQRLRVKEELKDIVNIIIIAFSIPVITLSFAQYASITIWAFPVIIIIFALVFNRRYVLLILGISIILTQTMVWALAPTAQVTVDSIDYIERLCIFGISLWMAFYINRIYIFRLKENAEQTRMQRLVSEISSDFVTVNAANLEEKIRAALELGGRYVQTDRAIVALFDSAVKNIARYEWCQDGVQPETELFRPAHQCKWIVDEIRQNRIVQISDLGELPPEAFREREEMLGSKISSLLALPIRGKDTCMGFIGFYSGAESRAWRSDHIILAELLSSIFSDAFIKVEAENEINKMAYFDHLTNLPNRLMFKDRVEQAIALAKRMGKKIGIMFLDLDSFKNVNDTMGHEGGDELLKTVSEILIKNVRKSDTVSRFGGDEFLILFNLMDNDSDTKQIADHVMNLFNKPVKLDQQEFYITVSAGIALYPDDGEDTESLIKSADIAMYSAKAKGKNQYVLCTDAMKEEIHTKMRITNCLYFALERNELALVYQPQISLASGHIIGLEALLRWNQPEMGMISPAVFIPLSEQTGLINSIGEWVLRTACRQNKQWQDMGLPQIRMAVNVSVNQFRNPDLVGQIKRILEETQLNPRYLELEITESIAINEANYIIDVMSNLKKLGVSISIDDFGTEYSSLSRLKMLPIDRLKMDMQFVHGIDSGSKEQAITKVIISLAKNLGIKVVAEGVETEHQLAFLSQRMCDEVQGFYYYKPMPAYELEQILRSGKFETVNG